VASAVRRSLNSLPSACYACLPDIWLLPAVWRALVCLYFLIVFHSPSGAGGCVCRLSPFSLCLYAAFLLSPASFPRLLAFYFRPAYLLLPVL